MSSHFQLLKYAVEAPLPQLRKEIAEQSSTTSKKKSSSFKRENGGNGRIISITEESHKIKKTGQAITMYRVQVSSAEGGEYNRLGFVHLVEVTNCMLCASNYSTINPKYSCCACGNVVCASCSPNAAYLAEIQTDKKVRICNSCYTNKDVISVFQSSVVTSTSNQQQQQQQQQQHQGSDVASSPTTQMFGKVGNTNQVIDSVFYYYISDLLGREKSEKLDIAPWLDTLEDEALFNALASLPTLEVIFRDQQTLSANAIQCFHRIIAPRLITLELHNCSREVFIDIIKNYSNNITHDLTLSLHGAKWFDDNCAEFLAKKLGKRIRQLALINATLTNHGLFHLRKKSVGITALTLSCCPSVTDTGVVEFAKCTTLIKLSLQHNLRLTDTSIIPFILNASKMTEVTIINCPLITEQTVSLLYDARQSTGNRRISVGYTLQSLILNDLPLLTADCFTYISASMQGLTALDVSTCSNIHMANALREICANLKSLTTLRIGPSSVKLSNPDPFADALAVMIGSLQCLSINGVVGIRDEDLGRLLEGSNSTSADEESVLHHLELINLPFATQTVESLCSFVPNIHILHLVGSAIVADVDIRCVSSVCFQLRELKVSQCATLTDAAFTRLANLRRLSKVEVSHCRGATVNSVIKYLVTAPLVELRLDGLAFGTVDSTATKHCGSDVRELNNFALLPRYALLEQLSLREVTFPTVGILTSILNYFVFVCKVDVTNTEHPNLAEVYRTAVKHVNPLLDFIQQPDWYGYARITSRQVLVRFQAMRQYCKLQKAARRITRFFHRCLMKKTQFKQVRSEMWTRFTAQQVVRIQSVLRMFLARCVVRRRRHAAWLLTMYLRAFVRHVNFIRYQHARKAYLLLHKRMIFRSIARNCRNNLTHYHVATERIQQATYRANLRRWYRKMLALRGIIAELIFMDASRIFRDINLLKVTFQSWSKCLQSTRTHDRLIHAKKMMIMLPLSSQNSSRNKHNQLIAEHFRNGILLGRCWNVMAFNQAERRKIEALMPRAIQHSNKVFVKRVLIPVFKGIDLYRRLRKRKFILLAKGEKHFKHYTSVVSLHDALYYSQVRYFLKVTWKKADNIRNTFLKRELIQQWIKTVHTRIHYKQSMHKAKVHHRAHLIAKGMVDLFNGALFYRDYKRMNTKAQLFANLKTSIKAYKAWLIYQANSKRLDEYYYHLYVLRQQRKVIHILNVNTAANKDTVRALELTILQSTKEAAKVQAVISLIIKFQARFRAKRAQEKFAETRIQKLFSVQILQNFFRTMLARKEFGRRLKLELIQEKVREDKENDMMIEAELEKRYFDYKYNAILTIQRVFRGWIGRKLALANAIEFFRDRSKEFYEEGKNRRLYHEVYLRALHLKELLRQRSATQIQKVIRGKLARNKFAEMKREARINKLAVHVQAAYRRRMAQLKLTSLKRAINASDRFQQARKQRGYMLRLFGFRKRKQQCSISKFVKRMGIDPVSFNYRIGELFHETIQDFDRFKDILTRERELFREHGLNFLNITIGRRKVLAAQGWKYTVHDAVRIIEPGHQFEGCTGVIVRIDETLLGIPLYEIRLDQYEGRQTFVRMSTDPLYAYTHSQPLAKITIDPTVDPSSFRVPYFGINPEDLLFTKKNIYAALRIQLAYRMYRAKCIVARKRYERWRRCLHRQLNFYSQFQDFNALSFQGYNISKIFSLQPPMPVRFHEIRHKIQPARLKANVTKINEIKSIQKEADIRSKDRLKFLQKAALMQSKDFFSLGYEQLTLVRKGRFLLQQMFGLHRKSPSASLGGNTALKVIAGKETLVTGMDRFRFPQFKASPHVRYYKSSLYQGEWSGIPLLSQLTPHGEGVVFFLDGWGFAREDKVLYLTIVRCKYLNAMDISTSDPYCDIICNGISLQTSIKWSNLNPEYHESFELDVTNPNESLNIVVKDKDFFGSDDFMGQILIPLSTFADGKDHHLVLQLRGEDVKNTEDFDRGEIEIRVRWAERLFEDDQKRLEQKKYMVKRLQAWSRRISALNQLNRLRELRKQNLLMLRKCAIKITNTCRIRLSRREYKRLQRNLKSAIKIQKRVRIWIAKRVFALRKLRHFKVIVIQARMRVCLAKALLLRLKARAKADIDKVMTMIQKNVRRFLAISLVRKMRVANNTAAAVVANTADSADTTAEEIQLPPVAEWIGTYGVDPEYRLKRNRRITERLFQKILRTKYIRMVTRYGVVYNDCYPSRSLLPESAVSAATDIPAAAEDAKAAADSTANSLEIDPYTFVSVYLPPFQPIAVRRYRAIQICSDANHIASLHLPSSVDMRKTVEYNITTIQCAVRQIQARGRQRRMIRAIIAIVMFQRRFRRRYEKLHHAAIKITSLFKRANATLYVKVLLKEMRAVKTIQRSFRCYQARDALFNLRCVEKLSVLRANPLSVEFHEPEKCLEHRSDTFWMSLSNTFAEIKVEFTKTENIMEVWIMTSTYSASPNFVSIAAVLDKKNKAYDTLIERAELPLLKEHQWHKFVIPITATKFVHVSFYDNYGDTDYISVRQIRFLRSKERSAEIVKQPHHFVLNEGPILGEQRTIQLKCTAEGWPLPTYQWYHNDVAIPNANQPELSVDLYCDTHGARTYRCIRCKMVSTTVPMNAYHVCCGNCGYIFNYKEAEEFDKEIQLIRTEETSYDKSRNSLLTSKIQMKSFNNHEKYAALLADIDIQLEVIEATLQSLREKRFTLKKIAKTTNWYTGEGLYYCLVQNIRGGSLHIKRKSVTSVVIVEQPKPYIVHVMPLYIPRDKVPRKKWPTYSSIVGTMRKGVLEGLVLIRYNDGSFYEGPYVREDAVDTLGQTRISFRKSNHYGVFKTADGRVFEGSNVDNHFDPFNLQTFYRVTFPPAGGGNATGNGVVAVAGSIGNAVSSSTAAGGTAANTGSMIASSSLSTATSNNSNSNNNNNNNTSEQYEGDFCDEQFHGRGVYRYADGSWYEGNWHRGTRFGHGQLRSATEGWTYEGFFDKDRRHRFGMIDYPNGSCYCGDWYYDTIQGRGLMITTLHDIYRGEFLNGLFHGYGELHYSDGSHYIGNFLNGLRHGPGIFTEREGNEFYGNYIADKRHGEHVVKVIIPIEEDGQDNYEIRIGNYNHGDLTHWKIKFSNPIATKQFIYLFKTNREMFDSVFSMILAKSLPNLPEGIDGNDTMIKAIVFKIRMEAGMLVGQQALNQAQAQLDALLPPLEKRRQELSDLNKNIEFLSSKIVHLEKESHDLYLKFTGLITKYEKDTAKIEQFWTDDPKQVRVQFRQACKKLDTITIDQYFSFRNHRVVPPFVKKIFDAIHYLLNLPTEENNWNEQQMIIADAIANARNGDEEALRLDYRCKLSYMMHEYKVYDYIHTKQDEELAKILADVRFRADSFYIESTGAPGPVLVEWIKSNYAYIKTAAQINNILTIAEERKIEAYRYKAMQSKKKDEIEETNALLERTKKQLENANTDLEEVQHAVLKANDLLQFITGRFTFGLTEGKQDYYKLFEQRLEAKRDQLAIEVCTQGIIDRVVERHDKEKRAIQLQLFATGKIASMAPAQEEVIKQELILDWIHEEVRSQQNSVLTSGRTLGYTLEPEATDVTFAYSMQLVTLIVDIVIGKLNDRYNDLASARVWRSTRGRKITARFLYIFTWKIWEEEAKTLADQKAVTAWEQIFGSTEQCAIMAIEAEVNPRMSRIAKAQGKVWARLHPADMKYAQEYLSTLFAEDYTTHDELVQAALFIDTDESDMSITPATRAQCRCWIREHPDAVREEKDRQHREFSQSFDDNFGSESGMTAARVINGLGNEDENEWYQYAIYWKEFNAEAYETAMNLLVTDMAKDFIDAYPLSTNYEVAKMIEGNLIANYIQDEEVRLEHAANPKLIYHAFCWGSKNQGLLRKGKETFRKECIERYHKDWNELIVATEHFKKGSAIAIVLDDQGNDRFLGFRNRIQSKLAWLYGFMCREREIILKELEDHEKSDPLYKVLHRVRPSRKDEIVDQMERQFLKTKGELQKRLDDVLSKLGAWNTYFGTVTNVEAISK